MKFHGITMVGPFVNQKLVAKPDPFVPDRDQGRLIWLTDGTLWYGSDTEWVNFSSGAGDASEVEDMYSDLLRTTIFLNGSYDAFELDYDENDLVDSTDMDHDAKEKYYTYTSNQYIVSDNLYDPTTSMTFIDYVLPSVDFVETGSPTIEVSSNGGVTWFTADNNRIYRIPNENAAVDLRMRFTGNSVGILKSWGILYNKDLTAACTKYGLTYANFEAEEGQTTFELDYVPNAIQVFLNGDLLDVSDYVATSGTDVIFNISLHAGDIVYIISYSTSILNPNMDFDDFIRKDGSIVYEANQPMGDNKLTGLIDGVDPQDSITKQQFDDGLAGLSSDIGNIDLTAYTKTDGSRPFRGDQSMDLNKLTGLGYATGTRDAVAYGQLLESNTRIYNIEHSSGFVNVRSSSGTITLAVGYYDVYCIGGGGGGGGSRGYQDGCGGGGGACGYRRIHVTTAHTFSVTVGAGGAGGYGPGYGSSGTAGNGGTGGTTRFVGYGDVSTTDAGGGGGGGGGVNNSEFGQGGLGSRAAVGQIEWYGESGLTPLNSTYGYSVTDQVWGSYGGASGGPMGSIMNDGGASGGTTGTTGTGQFGAGGEGGNGGSYGTAGATGVVMVFGV